MLVHCHAILATIGNGAADAVVGGLQVVEGIVAGGGLGGGRVPGLLEGKLGEVLVLQLLYTCVYIYMYSP